MDRARSISTTWWRYHWDCIISFTVNCLSRPSKHAGNQVELSGKAEVSMCLSREQQEATTSSGAWALLDPPAPPGSRKCHLHPVADQLPVLSAAARASSNQTAVLSTGTALWSEITHWCGIFFFFALSKVQNIFWPPNTSQWGQIEIQQIMQRVNRAFFLLSSYAENSSKQDNWEITVQAEAHACPQ